MDYGDSVEDEWLVVYMLRQLSLSHQNLWIRVFDSDGEFLLIEAANMLPKWLNPEMDRNRTWLHNGKLYLIPLSEGDKKGGSPVSLTLADAISVVVQGKPDSLVQSDLIEAEAFYRLEKYPGHITKSLHHTTVSIPRNLAYILHERPKAVAPAVEAFYLRDAPSMKPLYSSTSGGQQLNFPPKDLVSVSVKFTRVLFAQLRSQRFDPPPGWAELLSKQPDGKPRQQLEMGMKLACGFEMMVARLDKIDNRAAREVGIILDDLREEGDELLPKDDEIRQWKDSSRDDDESWMDIDYRDFERELDNKGTGARGAEGGFGDVTTQDDLRKLVSRFESFLNDDKAGLDGAEMDEMDQDDDETDSEEDDSDDEDKAVSFDEEAFAQMMKEMMGLPPDEEKTAAPAPASGQRATATRSTSQKGKAAEAARDSDVEEEEDIQELAAQFEAELNEHGALKLDAPPKQTTAIKDSKKTKGKMRMSTLAEDDSEESDDEGEVDIDYNLAKNLLESFKSQAGMAGPAGNILGMMGMQLPRDEDDSDEDQSGKKK